MRSGKAPGSDSIPAEIYKYGGEALSVRLTDLFTAIWETGTVPQQHKDALIIHLYKPNHNKLSIRQDLRKTAYA